MARATVRKVMHEKVRGLAAKGLTQAEAARELGVSRQWVSQLAAQLGLAFSPKVPPLSEEHLRDLAEKGLTRREAARQLGLSPQRVSRHGQRLRVSFAPAWSRPKAAGSKLGSILQAARLASGYSYPRFAALSGLHAKHVKAIERGWVRRPTARTLRALADCLAGHTSYEELARAVPGGSASPR